MTDLISREAALALLEKIANGTIVLGGQRYRTIQHGEIETAIRVLPAVTPKVKPLVWEAGERDQRRFDSILGEFCVTFFGGRWFYQGEPRKGMLDAQAASQADYEARILAALDLSPTPVDASQTPDPVLSDPRVKALVDHLERWLELASHCAIEEGVCCCGDNMEGHSEPMNCGHSPVDHGSYIAQHLVESSLAALRAIGGEA